jgi:hypothetical protein
MKVSEYSDYASAGSRVLPKTILHLQPYLRNLYSALLPYRLEIITMFVRCTKGIN